MSPDNALLHAPRVTYYNPLLDPRAQMLKMTPKWVDAVNSGKYKDGGPLNEPDFDHPFNLVSSLCTDGSHRPALDIDNPTPDVMHLLATEYGPLVVVASSTPNHLHAYAPCVEMTWDEYSVELVHLTAAGVIDEPYRLASVGRGQTLLRPPHVRKIVRGA